MSKRLPEFDDCQSLERLTGGDYCEARNMVCYASAQTGGILLKNLTTSSIKRITAGGQGECSPAFSPDGTKILFLSVVKGWGRQLFCYELDTEKLWQVTKISGAVMEPIWSPDGKRILFSMITGSKKRNEDAEKKYADEPVVIEDFGYKFDGMGFIRPDSHWQLFVVSEKGGEAIQLTDGEFDYMHANWAPDSQKIVCVGNRFRSREESIGYDLLLIDTAAKMGELTRLTKEYWIVSYPNPIRPVFTPDGKFVVAGILNPEAMGTEHGYPEIYFYQIDIKSGEGKQIFIPDAGCYQCVQFPYNAGCGWGMDKVQLSPDGRFIFFVSGWQGQGNLYCLDRLGDGHARLLSGGKLVYHGLSKIQNGKFMAARAESDLPEAYYIIDAESGMILHQAVQSAETMLETVQLVTPEDFFFETLDGESRVHTWILPPHNREKNKKYPAILYVHGGPHPFYTYGLTMEFQCLAALGFAVIYCNPRGSSGYGWIHQNCARSVDGSAYYDCLQCVDEAIRRYDWIDGERLGVTGGSYGGYMTNYIATHSKKFKAYVTQRSISNELISYASSDMQGDSKAFQSFEDFMIDGLKKSAVAYAERVDKPFLILHGMDDYRTPVEGAHQLFVALKDLHPDLPVKMVLFPHTGHEQPSNPRLLKLYYKELAGWFQKYL